MPEEFGVVAFALALVAYLDVIGIALSSALVQRADAKDARIASTAFWLGLAAAVVLVALAWLLAPLAARWGPEGDLVWLIRVLSLQLIFTALSATPAGLLTHGLDFRRLFAPEFASGLVKGVVSVALALGGAGVWSLVAGQLAGAAVGTVVIWAVASWRPRLVIVRGVVPPIVRFGAGIVAVAVLGQGIQNVDYLIVGARLGAEALGLYMLAFKLPELTVFALSDVAWRVLFPYYARLRDDAPTEGAGRLAAGYVESVRLGALVTFPLGATMAALAVPLVLLLYGDAWRESALPMALIALWAPLTGIAGMPGTVFKAVGRPGLLTQTSAVYFAVLFPALLVGSAWGIAAVAAVHVVVRAASVGFYSVVVSRVIDVGRWETVAAILPGLVAGIVVALPALAAAVLIEPPLLALAVGGAGAAGAYVLAVRLFFPRDLERLLAPLRALAGGRAAARRVAVRAG